MASIMNASLRAVGYGSRSLIKGRASPRMRSRESSSVSSELTALELEIEEEVVWVFRSPRL
jgi:hypothetical protein